MLLPSALPCEPRPPLRRHGQYKGYRLPAPAPVQRQSPLATGISSTCRALHSLLGVQPTSSNLNIQKLRNTNTSPHLNSRVEKCSSTSPHRACKRRRYIFESDEENLCETQSDQEKDKPQPSTPKRRRKAPPSIPFGLEPGDFYNLPTTPHQQALSPGQEELVQGVEQIKKPLHDVPEATLYRDRGFSDEANDENNGWDDENDRILVEMVLDKLKLSKREWDECARILGTDQRSLGRRWRLLVDEGQVGLKFRRRSRRRRGDARSLWR